MDMQKIKIRLTYPSNNFNTKKIFKKKKGKDYNRRKMRRK